jgi:hypothetical protein
MAEAVNPAALAQAVAAAVGLALSPVAVAAVVLLLLSPRADRTGIGFLLGWTCGIAIPVGIFALLAGAAPLRAPGAAPVVLGVIQLVLGLLFLGLAIARWAGRARDSDRLQIPRWMRAVDRVTMPVAFAAGAVMAVNPANLMLSFAGGIALAEIGGPLAVTIAAVLFMVIAVSTVLAPVVAHRIAGETVREPLARTRTWLARHDRVLLTSVFAVLAVLSLWFGVSTLAAASS